MLKEINIKAVYNSEEDNILQDFYIPVLKESVSYDRAVGYFDAKMLVSAARGLTSFIRNNGHMRLIVGNTLDEEEYLAIEKGYNERAILEKIEKEFEQIVESAKSDLFDYQLNTLSWLIKNNRLDIKMAFRKHGIHHQKLGIFRDSKGDFIVFQGSANETNNALLPFNYEVINVFKGWQDELKEHYEPHLHAFQKLWDNQTSNTLVVDFSEITDRVLSKKHNSPFPPSPIEEIELWQKYLDDKSKPQEAQAHSENVPRVPDTIHDSPFELRAHQREALNNWKKNDFKGLFELATGAGKTITAIYAIVRMYESRKRLFPIVSVPYQNLADQWGKELEMFNIKPMICYGGEHRWKADLEEKIIDFNSGLIDFCAVVVVDATLSSKNRTFSNFIKSFHDNNSDYLMFIGDECHHHGTIAISNVLPKNATMRIGLSATPSRGGEEEDIGDNIIQEYYGDVVARYTLADALNDNVLTPYEYKLIPVSLTEDEAYEYLELSDKIATRFAILENSGSSPSDDMNLNSLLRKRTNIINGTQNKEVELRKILDSIKEPIKQSLFYCAEGFKEGEDSDGRRRIEAISKILNEYSWKSSQFTSYEGKRERQKRLDDFKEGRIDSLVAMKCLDEGIDIPACSTAFILASSRMPRQFIQRRGRILRKSPGKTKAVIYDFFVTLPLSEIGSTERARKLMIQELKRIKEFADLAENRVDVYSNLLPYLEQHDLSHYI